MSTYYLLVSAGGDTLSVDGTTILAYQAGSVEGPGGSFTLTPVFDTALISLPSEVEVWYSTDNVTFSRTAGIAGATWANNVLSGTVGSSTTIYAKLYYSTGTPVTDENGAGLPLVAVSATVGGAPAPTIGTATITGSTAPTAGTAEAYSVAFDGDATDVTYAWTTTDGGATIATPTASSTNITFAATGSVTVTCTLTSVQAGETVVDTHVVTVAAAGLTLAIHDAFNGSGSASGRTPDTVNNGNSWTIDGIDYTVSSGYVYANTSSGLGGLFIDSSATSVQLQVVTQGHEIAANQFRHFLILNYNPSTGAFERIGLQTPTELTHQVWDGATFTTNVTLDTFLAVPDNTDILWTVDANASSVSWNLSHSGTTFTSGSLTPSNGPDRVGFWARYTNTGTHCADFKVYT